ncbi:MAG: hypothetical protein O3A78_07740 [Nitrospinae bacterium]|jgi:hypothetical protein|nr:hypothetical protein [Nitrospinota bacterium]MDA1109692.1 hypothetical protein [Nitrospinota bacterium]
MSKTKICCVLIFLLSLTGCMVKYNFVENKRITIAETYSVEPQITWSGKTIDNNHMWTLNGPNLERIVFLNNIKDGETLFKNEKSQPFKKGLNIIELAELFSNSMQKDGKWLKVKTLNLQPKNFGPFDGFNFETTMVSEKGLAYRGLVSGAVIEEELFLVFYLAVEMHYYPKHIEHFKNMLSSIQKVKGSKQVKTGKNDEI